MDDSTEGVTLQAGFVFDVLSEYEGLRRICEPIFAMTDHLDRSAPTAQVPMHIYNHVCDWVEQRIGTASVKSAGRAIGRRAFEAIKASGDLPDTEPLSLMKALQWAAATMIQDPKGRGWEIESAEPRRIVMKRTQSFNCVLQEGLLLSLAERSGVFMPSVRHLTCTRRGDDYCRYEIIWLRNRRLGQTA